MSKINRREALSCLAGSAAALSLADSLNAEETKRTRLGLVTYCSRFRRDAMKRKSAVFDLFASLNFLRHCHSLGAGGMQCALGVMNADEIRHLSTLADKHQLYVEAIVRLPKEKNDLDRFRSEMKTVAAAGVKVARTTIIPGRRYEYFDSLEMFKQFDARGRAMLERAAPIAEQHRIALAVENHKDHRDAERVALFKQISSEYVGACVDTGNSFALLEDPIGTVEALAPWAHSVHLKDQALQLYDDGFLLADIPLGQGGLDLKRMVQILQKAKPKINFSLELITRDPLKVPCLTDDYWRTFPNLPAKDLARTLRYVREHSSNNLQYINRMSPQQKVDREDANVRESLEYAREHLGM